MCIRDRYDAVGYRCHHCRRGGGCRGADRAAAAQEWKVRQAVVGNTVKVRRYGKTDNLPESDLYCCLLYTSRCV